MKFQIIDLLNQKKYNDIMSEAYPDTFVFRNTETIQVPLKPITKVLLLDLPWQRPKILFCAMSKLLND